MYTLQIVNGDIAVRGDGKTPKLTGAKRIEQELSCWILEPLGTDKIYNGFGSTLGDMVGSPSLGNYLLEIRDEVTRVVNNYITYQRNNFDSIRNTNVQTMVNSWNEDDLIATVDAIEVETIADTVQITVKLTTVAGSAVNVNQVI